MRCNKMDDISVLWMKSDAVLGIWIMVRNNERT